MIKSSLWIRKPATPYVSQSKIARVWIGGWGGVSLECFLLGFVDFYFFLLDESYAALFLLKQELKLLEQDKSSWIPKNTRQRQHSPEDKSNSKTDCTVNKKRNFHSCGRHPEVPQALQGQLLTTPIGQEQRNSTRTTVLGQGRENPRGLPTHAFAKGKVKARIQSKS